MTNGVITLGQVAEKTGMLVIACSKCDRKGRLRVSRLIREHGAEVGLPALKLTLAGDCPRIRSGEVSIYNRCGAHFPELPILFMR